MSDSQTKRADSTPPGNLQVSPSGILLPGNYTAEEAARLAVDMLLPEEPIGPRDQVAPDARCRVCGCTSEHACPGGCVWVTDPEALGDLCSRCAVLRWRLSEEECLDLIR